MANAKNIMIWSDDEVGLLLQISLDYKVNKIQEGVDWETCRSKYEDITALFEEQCPRGSTDKDFPHRDAVAKGQVTSKLNLVKRNYRKAVDAGHRSGNGRVMLFFELCEQLWGDSPATRGIDSGFETTDLLESPDLEDSPPESEIAESEPELSGIPPPAVVQQRRDFLQAKLNNHRGDRLKRKLSGEQEDREIRRRTMVLLEESSKADQRSMDRLNDTMETISDSIKYGLALMREMCLPPQPSASFFAHPQSSSAGHGTDSFMGNQC